MGERLVQFRYKLYDKNDIYIRDLATVKKCSITYDSLSTIKARASITMKEDLEIDYLNDRIQPIVKIEGVEYPQGIFLISSPNRSIDSIKVEREITLFSKIQLLADDRITARLFIPLSTNAVNECIRLIGANAYDITPSSLTTSTDKEYEIGTRKIEVINDLLKTINYTSLYPTGTGVFKAIPYEIPTDRPHNILYQQGFDENGKATLILAAMQEEYNYFDIPNRVIATTNSLDITPPLVAIAENNNMDNPLSIPNWRVVDAEPLIVDDVANQTVLNEIAKKKLYELSERYSHVSFTTGINPIHGYLDCIWLNVGDINRKYIETYWTMDMVLGGKMEHRVRRVVAI